MAAVLRIQPGQRVRLLDGIGREGVFIVTGVAKHTVALTPERIFMHERPESTVTLAVGYGRGIRRGWLLEKAVELEAGGVWFWQAERSQGKVPAIGKETWFAQMAAGAKQSNNPYLPELRTVTGGVTELVAAREGFDKTYVLWEGDTNGAVLSFSEVASPGNKLFVLGPEGGFTDREITELVHASFVPVSLGKRVLRWETAALLCLGFAWWARQCAATAGSQGKL